MVFSNPVAFSAVGLALLGTLWMGFQRKRHTPPGPRRLPFFGNLFQMPLKENYRVLADWAKQYGEVIYIDLVGQPIFVLSSHQAAHDLLEKRSATSMDRPRFLFAEYAQQSKATPLLSSNNPRFRRSRTLNQMALSKERVRELRPLQEELVLDTLLLLLDEPDNFFKHIRYLTTAGLMKMAYGYKALRENDPMVLCVEQGMDNFARAIVPGAWPVEVFPWLGLIPSWLPGGGFKKVAAEMAVISDYMVSKPFDDVKAAMASGTATPCITTQLLSTDDGTQIDEEQQDIIKWVLAGIYAGGTDTTVGGILTFILAMVLYPEAQEKAHEELDRVIGMMRLPLVEDRPNLPYIDALFKETLRWYPILPLGTNHCLTQDEVYNGYHLPKGSIILSNAWAIGHQAPDADLFRPERFLPEAERMELDPRLYAFGYGRRICPGRELGDLSTWLSIASILAAFHIGKKLDEYGQEITPNLRYSNGVIMQPEPFQCSFTPRHPSVTSLIRAYEIHL